MSVQRILNLLLPDQSADRTNLVSTCEVNAYVPAMLAQLTYFPCVYVRMSYAPHAMMCVMVVMVLVYSQTIKVCFQTVRP